MHSSALHMPSNSGLRVVNVFDMHMDSPLEIGITYETEVNTCGSKSAATSVDLDMLRCDIQVALYLDDGSPAPSYPVAGQRFMPLRTGDVVDVVVQNMAANANGDSQYSHLLQ